MQLPCGFLNAEALRPYFFVALLRQLHVSVRMVVHMSHSFYILTQSEAYCEIIASATFQVWRILYHSMGGLCDIKHHSGLGTFVKYSNGQSSILCGIWDLSKACSWPLRSVDSRCSSGGAKNTQLVTMVQHRQCWVPCCRTWGGTWRIQRRERLNCDGKDIKIRGLTWNRRLSMKGFPGRGESIRKKISELFGIAEYCICQIPWRCHVFKNIQLFYVLLGKKKIPSPNESMIWCFSS